MVDEKCPIDTIAFYADILRFEKMGIEPETNPCDYCTEKCCIFTDNQNPDYRMV